MGSVAMNLLRGAALVLVATVMVGGMGHEEEEGRIDNEALDSSLEASEGESKSEGGDWEQENFGSRTTGERSDGLLDRLKVDENAPSLPSRSLKRGRGRGSFASASREEGTNSISSHRRGWCRSQERGCRHWRSFRHAPEEKKKMERRSRKILSAK